MAEFRAARCDATVFVRDDRWGGWTNQCELPPDHDGLHSHAMTACEPHAELTWWTPRPVDDSDIEEGSEFDGPICI